jgi:PKD repeat protein
MLNSASHRVGTALALSALATIVAAGCTLSKNEQPALSGPSTFGLSINASASPDTLPRDGQSTSSVRFTVRNSSSDEPISNQRLQLTTTAGTLSASDVTTNANGDVVVQFTAPSVNTGATSARVMATPISELGVVNSGSRWVLIALNGPVVPVPSFTWTPSNPGKFDVVTFDASSTTVSGSPCLDLCTYSWNFGDATTAGANRITTHSYTSQGTFSVILTVTSADGISVTSTRSVVVGVPAAISAVITQSPTDAKVGQDVRFDASGSSTPDGAAIVSYEWDFGNGQTSSSRTPNPVQYGTASTYTVRLTITDEFGRTGTTTRSVTIGTP